MCICLPEMNIVLFKRLIMVLTVYKIINLFNRLINDVQYFSVDCNRPIVRSRSCINQDVIYLIKTNERSPGWHYPIIIG